MKQFLLLIIVTATLKTTAQNVGIGTSSPASLLDVSASQPDSRITWTNSANFGRLIFAQSGSLFSTIQHVGSTFSIANRQNALEIFNATPSGSVSFWTNAIERLRITGAGDFGIGTTTPLYKLHVIDPTPLSATIWGENNYVGTQLCMGIYGKSVNNPGRGFGVEGEGGFIGVRGNGNGTTSVSTSYGVFGTADGTTGTRMGVFGTASGGSTNYGVYCNGSGGYTGTWTLISDQKFKKDIRSVTGALDLIKQLNPVSYQLKKEEYPMMNFPSLRQYGFVAQELEKVIPLLVENGTHAGAKREDKDIELKAINYTGMIPVLTKAIQEQQEIIDEQKKTNGKNE